MWRFFRRVQHVFQYLPILWNDIDYDWTSTAILLKYKLERVHKHYEACELHAHRPKEKQSMLTCIHLLNRIINGYHEAEWIIHSEKYPGAFEDIPNGGFRMRPMAAEERADVKRISDREETLYKQDLELFAKIFSRHLRSWWC